MCLGGECGILPVAEGAEPEDPIVGDCKLVTCDGAGIAIEQNDDADLPVDASECTEDLCISGIPSNPPLALGELCGADATCDGMGLCTECNAPADCPGVDDECQTRSCTAGTCGFQFTANGTAAALQTDGDCQQVVCNGAGTTVALVDNNDVPVDNNDCTDDVCTAGARRIHRCRRARPAAPSGRVTDWETA